MSKETVIEVVSPNTLAAGALEIVAGAEAAAKTNMLEATADAIDADDSLLSDEALDDPAEGPDASSESSVAVSRIVELATASVLRAPEIPSFSAQLLQDRYDAAFVRVAEKPQINAQAMRRILPSQISAF